MDRNDAGILRTVITQAAAALAKDNNAAGQQIPNQLLGRALESCARLHNVQMYTRITLRLTHPMTHREIIDFFSRLLAEVTGVHDEE